MPGNNQGAPKHLQDKGPRRSQPTSNPPSRAGNASGRSLTRLSTDDLEQRTFHDEQGRLLGVDLINRSQGGGVQNNIVADDGTELGGVIGQTGVPTLIAEEAARLKAKTGADSIVFAMKPSFKRKNAKMRHRSDIYINSAKVGESSSAKLLKEPDRATEVTESEAGEPMCTNCKSSLHTLDRCLYAPKGTILGCPFCKNDTHKMEECSQFAAASTMDIVRALVWDRPNMPTWNTKIPWKSYLTKFLSTDEFRGLVAQSGCQAVLAAPFPWTNAFSRRFSRGNDLARLQAQLNDGITANLPSDPKATNIIVACKTYGVALELFWPEGLAEASALASASTPAPDSAEAPKPASAQAPASTPAPASVATSAKGTAAHRLDPGDFNAWISGGKTDLDNVTGALEKINVSNAMALDQDRED
ncbi:hypothetical protein NCS52_01005000 [Fusarium sp. LHS14.1]|nr:hypothetical protein NCS52_01005000 [Fusarium sp. LHS14.1]